MTAAANIGHNNPPSDAEILKERLESGNSELTQRAHDLVNAADRLPEITDHISAGKVGDYIKQITKTTQALEKKRVDEKEPFLSQGRIVDEFFKGYQNLLATAKAKAQQPLDKFARDEAERVRKQREEEARKQREAAEEELRKAAILEAQNKPTLADATFEQAQKADQTASKAERLAASNQSLVNAAGAESSTALRTRWVGKVVDPMTIDLEALRIHLPQDAIQTALNRFVANGGRKLKGATITQESSAVVR